MDLIMLNGKLTSNVLYINVLNWISFSATIHSLYCRNFLCRHRAERVTLMYCWIQNLAELCLCVTFLERSTLGGLVSAPVQAKYMLPGHGACTLPLSDHQRPADCQRFALSSVFSSRTSRFVCSGVRELHREIKTQILASSLWRTELAVS